jgi:Erv1 / Alr family
MKVRMDTRFWGPSGWRLLHLVAFAAPSLNKRYLLQFFENLPYVLPCKFCRASLTEYYASDPIPSDTKEFANWLYRIHNRVNGKLREQKLITGKDPTWHNVKQRYEKWMRQSCTQQAMIGWDFLYSVAYTTPCKDVTSTPISGAPPHPATPELKNRWNTMTIADRLPKFKLWWESLPHILPFPVWQKAWVKAVPHVPKLACGRKAVTEWLYKAEKAMCQELKENAPHDSFDGLCTELNAFASGCGKIKTTKVKTCRAKKTLKRKSLDRNRTRKYFATGGFS